MSSRFVRKDTFFKKAKQEGYRARSVYKLQEIQDKFHIVKKGDRVLDLGCAPGSFLQMLSSLVGEEGFVLGIDILPLPKLQAKNVTTMTADVRRLDTDNLLKDYGIPAFDVVTCDIAPNLSGIREVDDKNVVELYEAVARIATGVLKPGGRLVLKSFFTEAYGEIMTDLRRRFTKVHVFKPLASRSVSSETYFVCMSFNLK